MAPLAVADLPLDSLAAATSSAKGAALVKVFVRKTRGWSVGWVKALGLARVVVASSRWSKALNGWAGAVLVLIFGAASESSPTWTGETVTSVTDGLTTTCESERSGIGRPVGEKDRRTTTGAGSIPSAFHTASPIAVSP